MSVLDMFALVVLITLIASVIVLLVVLGMLPGRIARQRAHPQASAITVAGWMGLLTGFIWPFALIWAYTNARDVAGASETKEEAR